MNVAEIVQDAAGRVVDSSLVVLDEIPDETLHAMPSGANSIAWLVWHAARQWDVQLAAMTGAATVWASSDWGARTGIDRSDEDFGFGDTREQVASLRVACVEALVNYVRACVDALKDYVGGLSEADLDEIVDHYDGVPISRGVRLVSIIDDAVAHVGQAAYARGVVENWTIGY